MLPSFGRCLPKSVLGQDGEPKLTSDFPMLWGGHIEMPDSNSKLKPLSQIRSLRENQSFSFVAYPRICTLHRGLEITANLAPPWHCKISARANTGKHPEMATNQTTKALPQVSHTLGLHRANGINITRVMHDL